MKDAAARSHLRSPDSFAGFEAAECNQSIHRRFEGQAARRPDALALTMAAHDMTFAQLNAVANRTARRLLETAGPGDRPVALLLQQGYESVVWTLAILKAGLCYAPLDQRLPVTALRAMIDDLDPAALVAAPRYFDAARSLAAGRFPVVDADAALASDDQYSAGNLDRLVSPDRIAYVFYTSGSTGRPKGVADSHRHVLHNVLRYTNTLHFAPGDRLSLVQNPSFSGTVSSLFGALLNGAAVAPFDLLGDGLSTLSDWLRRARVTVFHAVPSIFRELSDPIGRFPGVRLIRLEGDRAAAADLLHFQANFQDDCTLVNGLGATECGLVRQFFVDCRTRISQSEPVPIGYPVPDVTVKVVDEQGREAPPEAIGEIVVESAFLATGYWRNPELTAQRFEEVGHGVRRYKTGDLGRLESDGCLVHLGRVDHRIRIAGEFIDTTGIERLLLGIPGIAQTVVHDYVDDAGGRKLCAYCVRDSSAVRITAGRVREVLTEFLGRHAVPATVMFLAALPLSKDRKIDRNRLPQPGRTRPDLPNDFVAPATALEEEMARVWSEVLGIDAVGVTDSLFDLGGDSIRAARIATRLSSRLGERIQIVTLFDHPTIRSLARAVAHDKPMASPRPAAAEINSVVPGRWRDGMDRPASRKSGAVAVWYLWTELLQPEEFSAFEKTLSFDERRRRDRLARDRDRRDFTAAHGLLRRALSGEAYPATIAPQDWQFEADPLGKPSVAASSGDSPAPEFSLSHTQELVACAIGWDVRVGIDVERIDPRVAERDIAAQWLSAEERDALAACPDDEYPYRFIELWTLKEAYGKALGTGLNMPPDSCSFSLGDHVELRTANPPGDVTWRFMSWAPSAATALSLAIDGPGGQDPVVVTVHPPAHAGSPALTLVRTTAELRYRVEGPGC